MTRLAAEEEFENVCGHGGKLKRVVWGWDSVFLKAILLSSLLGSRQLLLYKERYGKTWPGRKQLWDNIGDNAFLSSALRVWEVPGGTATLLQVEGAEDPGCV